MCGLKGSRKWHCGFSSCRLSADDDGPVSCGVNSRKSGFHPIVAAVRLYKGGGRRTDNDLSPAATPWQNGFADRVETIAGADAHRPGFETVAGDAVGFAVPPFEVRMIDVNEL